MPRQCRRRIPRIDENLAAIRHEILEVLLFDAHPMVAHVSGIRRQPEAQHVEQRLFRCLVRELVVEGLPSIGVVPHFAPLGFDERGKGQRAPGGLHDSRQAGDGAEARCAQPFQGVQRTDRGRAVRDPSPLERIVGVDQRDAVPEFALRGVVVDNPVKGGEPMEIQAVGVPANGIPGFGPMTVEERVGGLQVGRRARQGLLEKIDQLHPCTSPVDAVARAKGLFVSRAGG